MKRRAFLAGATAAGMATTVVPAVAPGPPMLALIDPYFDASRAFAAAARAAGIPVITTGRDVARLWYGGLEHQAMTLIGLATPTDALVLAGCASEVGRRAVIRMLHQPNGHRTLVGGDEIDLASVANAGNAWPIRLAELLIGLPQGDTAGSSLSLGRPEMATLASWRIEI